MRRPGRTAPARRPRRCGPPSARVVDAATGPSGRSTRAGAVVHGARCRRGSRPRRAPSSASPRVGPAMSARASRGSGSHLVDAAARAASDRSGHVGIEPVQEGERGPATAASPRSTAARRALAPAACLRPARARSGRRIGLDRLGSSTTRAPSRVTRFALQPAAAGSRAMLGLDRRSGRAKPSVSVVVVQRRRPAGCGRAPRRRRVRRPPSQGSRASASCGSRWHAAAVGQLELAAACRAPWRSARDRRRPAAAGVEAARGFAGLAGQRRPAVGQGFSASRAAVPRSRCRRSRRCCRSTASPPRPRSAEDTAAIVAPARGRRWPRGPPATMCASRGGSGSGASAPALGGDAALARPARPSPSSSLPRLAGAGAAGGGSSEGQPAAARRAPLGQVDRSRGLPGRRRGSPAVGEGRKGPAVSSSSYSR